MSSGAETLQFLSSVLSQRGPSSLPYSEDVKWLIRQHLLSLSETFPSLLIKTATFTHNYGGTSTLLQAGGTIPMLYQNVTYNLPIIIWLLEFYPRNPPLVFLNPTRDMIIKRPHPFVTPSASVNVPYLQNWVYPSSNLVDLARDLSLCFAKDPPLYSQRKPNPNNPNNPNPSNPNNPNYPNNPNNPNPNNPNYHNNANPNHSVNSGISSVGYGVANSNPNFNFRPGSIISSVMDRVTSNLGYGVGRTEEAAEGYKKNAINKLVDKVNGDMGELRKTREGEVEGLFSVQATLRAREEKVKRGLKEMNDEKEGLESQLQMVLTNADVLEEWLRENEEKLGKSGRSNVDVDEVFETCDVLSKQMLEASASDLAIEDLIYSLDKGVQEGVIPFDQYLRNVRLLSREQFFHRAMCAKVRASQAQACRHLV
ncbi:hypothetical protein RND81_03G089700 [Saponaria officinalis]|uniref:Protein ELC-like n=1 Tax=Saponaria officinalis TaxID=3572 RepID=A0AAW1M4S8_SAPOF